MTMIAMAITCVTLSPSPPPLLSISRAKATRYPPSLNTRLLLPTFAPLLPLRTVHVPRIRSTRSQFWRISAGPEEALSSDTTPLDSPQQIDDGVGTIISALLFIAFIVLSILTVGVIYLGVTDFLQKREKEKFEKEEAGKKKKNGGKKIKVRARAGPRGFGQKAIEEDVDDAAEE